MPVELKENHKDCHKKLEQSKTTRLQDDKTILHIKALNDLDIIKVDDGIIEQTRNNIRKCDYLTYSQTHTHLIELKGTWIDEAFKQLSATIDNLNQDEFYEYLIKNDNVYAIIVSPAPKKTPNADSKTNKLAKQLAKLNKDKEKNVLNYIKYAKLIPKLKNAIVKDKEIHYSGRAPVELY